MRFVILSIMVFLSVVSIAVCGDTIPSEQCKGIWASGAKPPYPAPDFIPTNITAPNETSSINATSDSLSLRQGNNSPSRLDVIVNPPLMEVLWAHDSKHFVINVSDGGLVGSWDVKLYSIDSNAQPVLHDIQKLVRPIANKRLQCDPKEEANLGAVLWLNNSKELLIIAEVPPHSSCQNMGAIFGFSVSVKTGEIIKRFSENDLRKKWAHVLGCRFVKR